jgi:glycosidase
MTTAPTWVNHSTWYHIFLDRFAGVDPARYDRWDEPIFLGGNLSAVQARLPYLIDLGIDVVWLSPFFETVAYHGYHVTDFTQVDPRFGTEADLVSLVQAAHEAGLRVIIDFVPNHCHEAHPYFQAAQGGDDAYRKWFFWDAEGQHVGYQSYSDMPKVNLDHGPARAHFIDAARHWLKLGVDGLRLDYAIGPSFDFWAAFRTAIKGEFPEVLLIGEVWLEKVLMRDLPQVDIRRKYWRWGEGAIPKADLQRDHIGYLDGVLDFHARDLLADVLGPGGSHAAVVAEQLATHQASYPAGYCLPIFLDNHDINRYLFDAEGDLAKFKTAIALQMAQPHPAIIYYGSEVGLSQTQSVWRKAPYADLEARRPFPWDESSWQQEILAAFQTGIRARKVRKAAQP